MEAEPAAAGVHRVAATALLCLLAAPRHVHSGEDHQSRGGQDEGSWAADDRRHKENVEVRIEVHSDPSVRSVAIVEGAEAHEVSRLATCLFVAQSRPPRISTDASLHHSGATGGSSRSGGGAPPPPPSS